MEALEEQQGRLLRLYEQYASVPLFSTAEAYEKYLAFLANIEATVRLRGAQGRGR